eukprot:4071007-Amphidinium_carterae.1
MPWPDQATSARVRSQSRGLKWADQSGEEEAGAPSRCRQMPASPWKPTEEAVAGMQPALYYLSHRMDPIAIDVNSGWATNVDVEWPPVSQTRIPTEYALECRRVLWENLKEFEAIPDGAPQWNFEAQDCFNGREKTARAEGHLADGSCMWPCGGNLE